MFPYIVALRQVDQTIRCPGATLNTAPWPAYHRWCCGLSRVVEMDLSLLSDLGAISRTTPEKDREEE